MFIKSIGFVAAFLTSVSVLPQLAKVIKTKSTHDISFFYFLLLTVGMVLWTVYGVATHVWPLIVANIFTGLIATVILGYKIRYK